MRAEHFGLHHLGEAEDGVERRPQFVAHLGEELRLGDVGAFRAPPRVVGYQFRLFELADQRVLLGARHQRRQARRIEPMGEQREIALSGNRHDAEDVVVQVALQREVQRDGEGHRHGCREHRDRQARRQHARDRDHQQHHEQHEGARALVLADRMDEVVHPGKAVEEIEDDEAQPPAFEILGCRRLGEELPALGDDDGVDHQHRRGPGAGYDRAGPDAGQEAHGADQQQDHERRRQAVLGELPQQFIVECDAGSGGRGQPLAGLPDALGGKPPALGQGLFARHGNVAVCCYAHNTPPTPTIGKRPKLA